MSGPKPVLASDWDDVMYEFLRHFLPYYNQSHGTNFRPEHNLDHDMSKLLGGDTQYFLEEVDKFHELGESTDQGVMPTAEEVIPVLAGKYDIVIVTARKKRFQHRISDMIARYLPGQIAAIYSLEDFEHLGYSKGAFVRELDAAVLVDDHFKNIEEAVAHNVRGLLWNLPKNIGYPVAADRVDNWYDVYEKLTGKSFKPTSRRSESGGQSADPA